MSSARLEELGVVNSMGVMLKDDRISQITEVPGLYISGRGPATYLPGLADSKITHIVSVMKDPEIIPKREPVEDWTSYQIKQIAINDDGSEDILIHLDEVYQWIDNALQPSQADDPNSNVVSENSNRVLVRCRAGMSRSGAFIVGYLMKKFSISYSAALTLARVSRPIINPNNGFEQQLRIYEHCRYDIYLPTSEFPSSSSTILSSEFAIANTQPISHRDRKFKAAYTVWKKERDARLGRGDDDRMRFGSMASMAAEFGRRRFEAQNKAKENPAEIGYDRSKATMKARSRRKSDPAASTETDIYVGGGVRAQSKLSLEDQWLKVEEMEKRWNGKLIRGELGGNPEAESSNQAMDDFVDN